MHRTTTPSDSDTGATLVLSPKSPLKTVLALFQVDGVNSLPSGTSSYRLLSLSLVLRSSPRLLVRLRTLERPSLARSSRFSSGISFITDMAIAQFKLTELFRILFFYVMGTFVISVLVPYTEPDLLNGSGTAAASPFVIAINNAGIKALPSIVNAVLLIAAWSAGNSDLYAASRTLYALALERQLPRVFRRCTKRGLPIWCVTVTALFGAFAYLNTGGEAAEEAFNWLYNLSAITGILTWW